MATHEKILKALESATGHLENSVSALISGDENSFGKHFWHVAAELEYALFIFSLIFREEDVDKSRWKPNPEVKKNSIHNVLAEIRGLLDNAKKFLTSGKVLNAYKGVYMARHHVFILEEILAKEKRKRLKAE